MKRVGTILFCLALAPSSGLAYNILGFDTARPVEPQHLEAGAGISIGDGAFALYGTGRIGLVPELEAFLRLGGLLIDKDPGAELSLGGKFRAIPAKHMADIADVAVGGELSVVKTDALFVLSLDPKVWVSRHFALPGDRELFISLTVGLATTLTDIDGGDDSGSVGFNGAFCTGLDIVKNMAFAVELRAREDARQVGLSVTYDF
jgi:hypothetical protein